MENNINTQVEEINIDGVIQKIREYQNQRVVTFKDIDTIHKRPDGTARKRFNDNKKRFVEGDDFFKVKCGDVRSFFGQTPPNGFNPDADIYLITESGYLLLVKSFTDELAWDVQKKLINSYFRKNNIISMTNNISTPLSREELAAYMIYNSQLIEGIKESNGNFINIIKENNELLLTQQLNSLNCMIDLVKDFCENESKQTEKYRCLLNKAIESYTKLFNQKDCYSSSTAFIPQNICNVEEDDWKRNAFKISEKICTNLNIKGKNVALLKIYANIKNNEGIDLDIEKEKYMKQNNVKKLSIISFISTSKKLRDLFDQYAKELLENTFCSYRDDDINNNKKTNIPFSQLAALTPVCIWDIVSPLYKIGYKKASVMRFVYKEMEEISGVSLNNIVNTYAKQHQIKNVSRGFVISKDENLKQILKEAVNNIMNKNI